MPPRNVAGEERGASGIGARFRAWVPAWWRGETGRWSAALHLPLLPAELAYRGVVAGRNRLYDRGWLRSAAAAVPTISVGNLSIGGTGKTPVSAWIAGRLRGMGRRPALVVRGYGRDEVEVHRELNPDVPVLVAPLRAEGVEEAARRGLDCAVLDDGFQHRAVARDVDLVLIAAERWRGPRRLLPRGPWREPASALARAHLGVVTRKTATRAEADDVAAEVVRLGKGIPVAVVHLAPGALTPLAPGASTSTPPSVSGRAVVAISTLADPAPFLDHLRGMGARVHPMTYPDHHHFTGHDLVTIDRALQNGIGVVTRKEAVKLRGRLRPQAEVYVLQQHVVLESGGDELDRLLRQALARTQ